MDLKEISQPKKYTLALDESELRAIIFVLGKAQLDRDEDAITGHTQLADQILRYLAKFL